MMVPQTEHATVSEGILLMEEVLKPYRPIRNIDASAKHYRQLLEDANTEGESYDPNALVTIEHVGNTKVERSEEEQKRYLSGVEASKNFKESVRATEFDATLTGRHEVSTRIHNMNAVRAAIQGNNIPTEALIEGILDGAEIPSTLRIFRELLRRAVGAPPARRKLPAIYLDPNFI